VAEHKFETGNSTDFSSMSILDTTTGYAECMIKEATEIRLHPRKFNRDRGFTLSQSWYPVINMLKQYRDPTIQRQAQTKHNLTLPNSP
jgi:hypothetical protein